MLRTVGMRTLTTACSGALTVALALLGTATPATAAPVPTTPAASPFGVHEAGVASGRWPQVPNGSIGSVRLWDTGTSWREVNPAPGVFVWGALDAAVANARKHGASVDLVLATTPQWAAQFPYQWAFAGDGTASPPRSEVDWVIYVQAVASRYKGLIGTYETWNEPNLAGFWQGSAAQMSRLNSLAYRTIKRIDPRATVAAPSVTLRGSGITWLSHYARYGGFRYSDAVNVHAYPLPAGTPEDSVRLMKRARAVLAAQGVRLPMWDTEINYGHSIAGIGPSYPLTSNQQAAFVVRTYLLGTSNGIARTYWYDWSAWPGLSVAMTLPNSRVNAPPAKAFVMVAAWMRGRMAPCTIDRAGTYTCTIAYARGSGVVTWNPVRTVTVTAPRFTRYRQNVYGSTAWTASGQRIRIGYSPTLFRTSR